MKTLKKPTVLHCRSANAQLDSPCRVVGAFIMKEIQLTQGKVALVDDEDYDYLMQWKWCAHKVYNTYYASRKYTKSKNPLEGSCMHWRIMNGKMIDHIDGNGLNNQKSNLRFCTNSQNQMNMRSNINSTSKYKGVCWKTRDKIWVAQIKLNQKVKHIGSFKNEEDAARAYDAKAKELFGEFARLNFKY